MTAGRGRKGERAAEPAGGVRAAHAAGEPPRVPGPAHREGAADGGAGAEGGRSGSRRAGPGGAAGGSVEVRALIVAAAVPLLVRHGAAALTTSMIARVTGLGQGAVHAAFADKQALLAQCVIAAVQPGRTAESIASGDPEEPLAARLAAAAEALRAQAARMRLVCAAMPYEIHGPLAGHPVLGAEFGRVRTALVALFTAERDGLCLPPQRLADAFQSLLTPAALPGSPEPLATRDLVALFLRGARGAADRTGDAE
ncbi:helix-turn-helix domain-containing protein [Streptomyces subrutilus]|uniref:TetR/AcrR family transcriptional regulator n=1 Tax=Streptomyces subrutilus TaxID=36818 RepID=UPI00341B91BF